MRRKVMGIFIKDNADRRTGIERRVFSYTVHIPEQRSGKEQRKSLGRRTGKVINFRSFLKRLGRNGNLQLQS